MMPLDHVQPHSMPMRHPEHSIVRSYPESRQRVRSVSMAPTVRARSGRASAAPSPSGGTSSSPQACVAFDADGTLAIRGPGLNGERVKMSMWVPCSPSGEEQQQEAVTTYAHRVSLAKVSKVLGGFTIPAFFDKVTALPAASGIVASSAASSADAERGGKAVILLHGYLGSRYDLVDFAEALVKEGFIVIAPEFADSRSDPARSLASRGAILEEAVALLATRFGIARADVALIGHSAGAGTALQAPGRFAARVLVAGFRSDKPSDAAEDPLLVIASGGDRVISLYPTEGGRFGPFEGIKSAVLNFRRRSSDGSALNEDVVAWATFDGSPESLRTLAAQAPRAAFVAYEGEGAPSHISFLSARTNDVLVQTLGPLLPVARLLDVPVLDFDVYERTRDSDRVLGDLVPAVRAWLIAQMAGQTAKL